ncbi:MAG: SPFH domain-containing protein [Patescibacteria group bacterium]
MNGIALLLVFAVMMIFGPVGAIAADHGLGSFATAVMMILGVILFLFSLTVLIVTRLYVKTKASEAFVRTGQGGAKVILNGGALVIPVIHQTVTVPLSTIRLEVQRVGVDALITLDKFRADIKAEFFVTVPPDEKSILNAARSFGDEIRSGTTAETVIKSKIEDKLTSALRTVAATMTLEELNSKRDQFLGHVTGIIKKELAPNGLDLETATISKLDQTDPKNLRDDNIFDAQGKRASVEITQKQMTERTALERQGDMERAKLNVAAKQQILQLEQTQAQAEATQKAEIAKVQAQQDQATKEAQIATQQAVELKGVERQKAVEIAQRGQQQAVEVAEQQKLQAIEVAQREKEKAVAEADKGRAEAQSALAGAEAGREKQVQSVTTVKVTAEADRAKAVQVIQAQGKAETEYLTASRKADSNAYAMQKDADARKAAAEADAMAKTKQAEGDKATAMVAVDVKRAEVEVAKAAAMVPVDVANAQVEVDKKRVDEVLKPELQARSQHGQAAQQFELAKLEIEKRAEVCIAAANAQVHLMGKVNMTVYGTPEQVAAMNSAFSKGMSLANLSEGFLAGAGPQTLGAANSLAGTLTGLVKAATDKLGGSVAEEPAAAPTAASNHGGNNAGGDAG